MAPYFQALSDALQLTQAGQEGAVRHISTIRARLATNFDLKKTLVIGSASRGTSIRGYSDVDLLAVFSRDEARHGGRYVDSDTFLRRIRDDLDARFHATKVRRDNQAIVLHFAQGADPVDVVPAVFHEFRGATRTPIYRIPDSNGGWLETAPEAHGNYLKQANESSRGKLRRTIQFLKHWKSCRENGPRISSIYLELLLASGQVCVGIKSYSQCLYEAFALLKEVECRRLVDPVGVAGVLYSSQTNAQWAKLVDAVNYAEQQASKALAAEREGKMDEACFRWGIVFNRIFPR